MSDTTTQERADEAAENLVDAAARAAEEAGSKTLATIRPDQQRFDSQQLAILRALGVEDASQGDLDLFFHVCRTTGLDPFRRQIYMIGRNTKVTEWVEDERAQNGRRRVEKWVTKYTIQTGIDGYRRNGREAAKMLGDEIAFDGPYYCGEDGQWTDVWLSKAAPLAAKFTIFRNGEPHTGIAHFDEFVQMAGAEPNSMWRKMPR
ncbi:MAG: recombinase RecT, partial [Mycolicibacterium frederiksbergense]|nr:recombinase RecT [Mycolicibacterium frederiksbergense]